MDSLTKNVLNTKVTTIFGVDWNVQNGKIIISHIDNIKEDLELDFF